MEIKIRHSSENKFADVTVNIGNASFDLGLHDKDGLKVFRMTLKDACQEIDAIIENMETWERINPTRNEE